MPFVRPRAVTRDFLTNPGPPPCESIATRPDYVEFLTLPASDRLTAVGG